MPEFVYHFSEDPGITLFRPHVARTRPAGSEPLVWAIDDEHAPLYWFPRDCPRVTFWAGPDTPSATIERLLGHTAAKRVHAIESGWLARMREVRLFVYRFDGAAFQATPGADGHWVSRQEVRPRSIEPVGDLLARHAEAGIELRITPNLWPLHEALPETGIRFSSVRLRNALPPDTPCSS